MSRRGRMALAAILGLSLVGCAGIGETTPVQQGLDVGGADVPRVRVFFPGPVNGTPPEQIIRGFVSAGAASDGDYDTARSFLTPDAAKAWSPDGEILVFSKEGELAVSAVDDATWRVTVPVIARISAEGRYTAAQPGETVEATFSFARIDQEWRIASLPDGFSRWLAAANVRRLVQPYAVHYVASDRRLLVQDVRWFPLDHLTSRLARAQLAPVPADLVGVATTAVPAGTRITAESVSVQSGVATVELSARPPTDQTLRLNLWGQFVATLTQDPAVVGVRLQVDGAPIDFPGSTGPVSDPAQAGFAAPPTTGGQVHVRRGDRLWVLDPEAPAADTESNREAAAAEDLPAIGQGWTGVAMSIDGRELAAVTQDGSGLSRWRGDQRYDLAPMGASLAHPTFDSRGYLWTATGTGDPGGTPLRAVALAQPPASAEVHSVGASWLVGLGVQALRVSPDGERVAVLAAAPGQAPRLFVAGIVRGAGAVPTRLADPVELGAAVGSKQGLVWLGPTGLATLATPDGGATRPVILSLDGTWTALTDTPEAVALTTPDNERNLIVLDRSGRVTVRAGQLWLGAGEGIDLVVPGR